MTARGGAHAGLPVLLERSTGSVRFEECMQVGFAASGGIDYLTYDARWIVS
jgi:hypothetical protein